MNQNYSPLIRLGPPWERKIALIFYINYTGNYLPEILKILNHNKVEATFFLTGAWLERNKHLLALIQKYGHEIGGCTYNCGDLTKLNQEQIELEIEKFIAIAGNENLINPAGLFSLPHNHYTRSLLETAAKYNYLQTVYPAINLGREQLNGLENLTETWIHIFKRGSLVSFQTDEEQTVKLLIKLIEQAERQQFSLLKVSQLLKSKHPYKSLITQAGETIFELGERAGVDPAIIAQLNRLPINKKPFPYQIVYLPADSNQFFTYTVLPGDTIETISIKFSLDQRLLEDLNGPLAVENLRPGQQILLPRDSGLSYTVQADDNLISISQQLAVPLVDLVFRNPQLIRIGQKLIVFPGNQDQIK